MLKSVLYLIYIAKTILIWFTYQYFIFCHLMNRIIKHILFDLYIDWLIYIFFSFFKFLSISMMNKLIGYAWHLIQYSTSSLPFDVLCNRVWIKRMWFFQRIIATRHWHIFRSFKRNRAKLTRWHHLNLQKKDTSLKLHNTFLQFISFDSLFNYMSTYKILSKYYNILFFRLLFLKVYLRDFSHTL